MITEKDRFKLTQAVVAHSVKKKRNFRMVFIILLVALTVILWLFSLHPTPETSFPQKAKILSQNSAKELEEIELIEKTICRSIKNHLPEEITAEFSPGEKVYYYTKIMFHDVPQKIKHLWVDPQGREFTIVELDITHQPANTWSRISLPPESSGTWLVKTLVGDKIIDETNFHVEEKK